MSTPVLERATAALQGFFGAQLTIEPTLSEHAELALALAKSITEVGTFEHVLVREEYYDWLDTEPVNISQAVYAGLNGRYEIESEEHVPLARVLPLAVHGAVLNPEVLREYARFDGATTHVNEFLLQYNELFSHMIAEMIRGVPAFAVLYEELKDIAQDRNYGLTLKRVLHEAKTNPPLEYRTKPGWAAVSFGNLIHQLLRTEDASDALSDTVERGGAVRDHAGLIGAAYGALYGEDAVPTEWRDALAGYETDRPAVYLPRDLPALAERLLREAKE